MFSIMISAAAAAFSSSHFALLHLLGVFITLSVTSRMISPSVLTAPLTALKEMRSSVYSLIFFPLNVRVGNSSSFPSTASALF